MNAAQLLPTANIPGAIVSLDASHDPTEVTVHTRIGALLNAAPHLTIQRLTEIARPPRSMRRFLDREQELAELLHELQPGRGAWLHGHGGCGLSALLRQAANTTAAQTLPAGVVYIDGEIDLPRPQTAPQPSVFSTYEKGLRQLLNRLGQEHPRYTEALIYQSRLLENIKLSQQYGDTDTRRADRAQIIDQLNQLALAAVGLAFSEADGLGAPSLRPESAKHPARLDDIVQDLFNRFYTSDVAVHVTLGMAQTYLGNLQALFILDSLPLGHAELIRLTDLLSSGAVLITASGPAPDTLLDMPLHGLPRQDAIRFCVAEASLYQPQPYTTTLVERLCAALDDLPLALRLAGRLIRSNVVALEQLVAALDEMTSHDESWSERTVGTADQPPADRRAAANPKLARERSGLARAAWLSLVALNHDELTTLAALVRAGAPDLDITALTAISQVPLAPMMSALERLIELGLVKSGAERYAVTSASLRQALDPLLQRGSERRRAASFFTAVANSHRDDLAWLESERGNLMAAAETALAEGHAVEAGELAQAVQPVLVLRGRWDTWARVIDLADQAARVSGDRALHAWALHERGTRAGLLGDYAAAAAALREAQRLRHELGDHAGVAASRYNTTYLNTLTPAPSVLSQMFVRLAARGRALLKRLSLPGSALPRRLPAVAGWSALVLLLILGCVGVANVGGFDLLGRLSRYFATTTPVGPIIIIASPVPSATPTPTDALVPTDAPVPTDALVPTDAPAPTDAPVPTNASPAPAAPSTDTPPPTDTPLPPTDTPVPPTDTPVPPADTPTVVPYIKVIYPSGGECWNREQVYTITWESNISDDIKIMLKGPPYDGSGGWFTIVDNTPNDGAFDYAIPANYGYDSFRIFVMNLSESVIATSDISSPLSGGC